MVKLVLLFILMAAVFDAKAYSCDGAGIAVVKRGD
jgi:hypothetical protein